ncbi:retinal-specific phospholipid-transporting ATPase ABCA4 [Ixodes scapularis]|uniref:retinal-specific phospholipid-transporting ATPase ABCA4 n=1 Tax=Ixodes scapularis TaxID=6945 RepID=UPI001C380B6E|nr:retinal-specific phospholipid-transporting ATPase ABCA4 [Ixodes scapularis]
MENHWNQFRLVLWKHVYMNRIRRHWAGTLLQVLAMVVLQYGVWEESVAPFAASPNKERSFDMTKPTDLWGQRNGSTPRGRLAFSPPSNPFGEVVRRACDRLGDLDPVPLANSTALDAYLRRRENGTRLLLGVQFEARDNDTNGSSSSLSYAVRAPFGTFDLQLQYKRHLLIPGPRDIGRFGEMRTLDFSPGLCIWWRDVGASVCSLQVELQRLPYPRLFYGSRKSEEQTLSLTALRFAIGFFVPFGVVVVTLVREKRSGMKGMLRRAGLGDGFYWLGHLAEGVFVVALSLTVMYVMLFGIYNQRGTTFLFYADSTLVIAVLMLFGLLTILHAMLLSVFLWNVCVSFAAAVVYWTLLSLAPYLWLQQVFGVGYYLVPRGRKMATSLSPVMFLHWCFRVIERFEKYGVSISWKHFFDKSTTMDNVSVGELVLISLNACMVLFFFVWYLDNVAPWNYGVPKSFYFLLSVDYWFPYRKWNIRNEMQTTDPNIYEQDPKASEPIIHIINVSKETTNSSYPLDRVNLTVFNNQITVFLGPENSGHKTLLKIITGTAVPSSGNVYICNFDVVNNPSKCWEFFSYCSSEIILFSDLTVKEHLLFFASLRKLDGEEAEEAVETVMRHLHLVNCKDELVAELCQKTQRMLCLAIATCTVNQN